MRELAIVSLSCAAAARLALAPLRRLSPDEAWYAIAARHGWPIVDHPPLLGWLLSATERLPGPVELRVRAVAVVCQAVTALAIGALAARIHEGEERATERFAWGVFLGTWGLMPWVSGLITTPDAPLLAATAVALWLASRPRPAPAALAIAVAIAVASKATGLVVAAALAIDLLRRRDRRAAAGVLVGALIAVPLVRASLVAQIGHALGRGALVSAPHIGAVAALGALLGGIVVLYGPAAVWLGFRGRADALRVVGALPLLAMLGSAVVLSALVSGRAPEPNWIAPAFVPLLAIGAVAADRATSRVRVAAQALHLAPALLGIVAWVAATGSATGAASPSPGDPLARVPRVDAGAGALEDVAGVPPYGRAAWRCLYGGRCQEIEWMFRTSTFTHHPLLQPPSDR